MKLASWPKPFRYIKDVRTFLLSISAVVAVFLTVVFLLRYAAVNELLVQSVKQEAESYADLIIVTRHWNARYGGVYVEKRPGVASNPYLEQLGVHPDLTTTDGRVLTLRNPAAMTREISEQASRENTVRFHMISLKPVNPENRPDAFERDALERFERGERDIWRIDRAGPQPLFRYVRPLTVEQPCLACHAQQGYRVGDIRGGVSVLVPAGRLMEQMSANRRHLITDFLLTLGLLLGIVAFMGWNLATRLDGVQKKLKRIATTDELTGLRNRRYIMEHLDKEYQRAARTGAPLSLVLLDIDHFKKINDNYGHAYGDVVLKAVAREMEAALRSYDLLGRIGGEEFLIASPGSTLDDAAGLAQRICERVRSLVIANPPGEVSVTISAGVTSLSEQDARADSLLARADEALYLAKQQGRDRVIAV